MVRWGAVVALCLLLAACGGSSTQSGNYGTAFNIASPSPSSSPKSSSTPGRTATPSARTSVPTPKPVPVATKGGGGKQYAAGYYTPHTGTYSYSDQTSGTGASPSSGSATVAVADGAQPNSTSYRQYFTLTNSQGSVTDNVIWSSSSRTIQSTVFGTGSSAFECDWSPPDLDLQLALSVGESWKTQSSCNISAGAGSGSISSNVTNNVTGTATSTVSGQAVAVYVISVSGTITISSTVGNSVINVTATEWFSPKYGLYVKETQETKSSSATTGSSDQTETLQLLSLNPS